ADAQVLNTSTASPDLDTLKRFLAPVLSTNTDPNAPDSTVANAQSFTYLVNNGDGTCGIAAEIHEHIAPVNIAAGSTLINVGGDWTLRALATGKPDGNYFHYGPDPTNDPSTPLIQVVDTTKPASDPAHILGQLTTQD